jgi:hypothetical protein
MVARFEPNRAIWSHPGGKNPQFATARMCKIMPGVIKMKNFAYLGLLL